MTDWEKNPVYIAGVAETPLGEVHDHTEFSMVAVAAQEALAEAGMTMKDVDGVFVNYMGEEGTLLITLHLTSFTFPCRVRIPAIRDIVS